MNRLACLLGLFLVAGCGSGPPELVPVCGRVVFRDGRPVTSGIIEFIPESGGPPARARISGEGTFELQTGERPGAHAGRYRVIIVQMLFAEGAQHSSRHFASNVIHPRYASLATSGLTQEIVPGHNELTLEVDPAEARKGW